LDVVFLVIFILAVAGSLVCLSVHLALKFIACKRQGETFVMGFGRAESAAAGPEVDPVLKFGFILSCYGAIALALVSALPGPLALERTALAFALLCVGGLIGEISGTGTSTSSTESTPDLSSINEQEDMPVFRQRGAPRLSAALMLMLNLAFAVLGCGQGLIEIVPPPKVGSSTKPPELNPIIVVAQRSYDPLE
jgi:hypothetical protein